MNEAIWHSRRRWGGRRRAKNLPRRQEVGTAVGCVVAYFQWFRMPQRWQTECR
jgi:hypothetical protein